MAAITPFLQRFEDLRNGTTVGIHFVKLVSTSDTVTVPSLANTTNSASSGQIRRAGEAAATVTDDGGFVVTIVGAVGDNVLFTTAHGPAVVNFGAEA